MRLLFDENISYRIVKRIAAVYRDCVSSVWLKLIGQPDTSVWEQAKLAGYDIVTFDEDYIGLSKFRGSPPRVIFVRPVMLTQPLADLLIREYEAIHLFLTSELEERGCLELIDFTQF
jgi:predicted nuclease of predicted toxin-antitoxin system